MAKSLVQWANVKRRIAIAKWSTNYNFSHLLFFYWSFYYSSLYLMSLLCFDASIKCRFSLLSFYVLSYTVFEQAFIWGCMWFGYNPQIIFCHFFHKLNLTIFRPLSIPMWMDKGIPYGRNSSYSFILILSKLHWRFGHGLKMCMWFGYNPQIIFCHFFHKLNLAIFPALSITKWMDRGYLVGATPPTVLCQFFRNFTGVLVMVWR